MGLMQLWVAVDDEYHFQRSFEGRTAEVFRVVGDWAYVVREGDRVVTHGRAPTWDDATEIASSCALRSSDHPAAHHAQESADERSSFASVW
jgi:hypothetical protein